MKGYCYIGLILAFFIFYQENPLYAIVIIALFIGVYLFFKSRSSSGNKRFGFLSGNPQQNSNIDDLIILVMLQQLMNSNESRSHNADEKRSEQKDQIDRAKKEVFDLLDEEYHDN